MTTPRTNPQTTPRIGPGTRHDVGLPAVVLARGAGLVAGTGPLNLFLTLGRQRRLFRGWLRFSGRLMPGGTLPRRESELAILRVAHLRGCRYEFDHHVRLSRRAGVGADDLRRVVEGPAADGWSPRDRAMLAAVDMLHEHQDIDDATWATLAEHLDEPQLVEYCLLVAHYEMLATVIITLRIQPDHPRRRLFNRPRVNRPRDRDRIPAA